MKTLLIATSNQFKIEMFKDLLNGIEDINPIFLTDLDYSIESPIEDGTTVEANALLKAKYYSEITSYSTLGDDSGFEVAELGGEPGIMARRWAGQLPDNVSDEDWMEFYLNKTKDIPGEYLHGSFPFARCLYLSNGEHYFQSDRIDFLLSRQPTGTYTKGSPISALRVFNDGRKELDIPVNDPIWKKNLKKEGLFELLKKL